MERRTNEEVIREGFLAFSEGRLEDCLKTLDPAVEWHVAFRLPDLPPELTVARGHDEVMEIWRRFRSVWESLVFSPEAILHDAENLAIVRIHIEAKGGESGIHLDQTVFYVLTMRDQKLLRTVPFDTLEEAAAEAGVDPAALKG